jgi:drug/metabolite transporter (DMT)-like permease
LQSIKPIVLATILTSSAFLWALIGALIFESPLDLSMSNQSLLGVMWLGFLGTCLAYVMYYELIRVWGVTRATLITYVLPVVSVVLGVIVLYEVVDWRLIVGFVLIAAGIVLVNLKFPSRSRVNVAMD